MPDAADIRALPLDIRHVVIEGPALYPTQANGLHTVVRSLIQEQMADGHQVRLFVLSDHDEGMTGPPGLAAERLIPDGWRIAGRPVLPGAGLLARLTEGAGPATLFHFHGARHPLFTAIALQLHRRGLPYGVTIHGQYSHVFDRHGHTRRLLPALYLRLAERMALNRARFIHALSPTETNLLRRTAPQARIHTLANAAYSSRLGSMPPCRKRPAPGGRPPVFGFCARYEIEHKGIDLLIEGFAAYRQAGGAGRLDLIGAGPGEAAMAALIRRHDLDDDPNSGPDGGGSVRILGPRFGADKTAATAGWHWFVLPSRFDAMPIGALEAALDGLPLLMTPETGLSETVERYGAGLIIAEPAIQAVAATLAAADRRSEADWRTMSDNARRMASEIADWTQVAAMLERLYRHS